MLRSLICALLLTGLAPAALAIEEKSEEGKVIWKERRCNFFIAQTAWGYTLLEHLNGPWPNDDDVFLGKMDGFGMRSLVNKSQGDEATLTYSEISSTSKKWVASKIPGFCKRKKAFVAQVEAEYAAGQNAAKPAAPADDTKGDDTTEPKQ